jgi:hypothetical protein
MRQHCICVVKKRQDNDLKAMEAQVHIVLSFTVPTFRCKYSAVKHFDQLFDAKARSSLMSSREGGGGLSEADVKVAIARLQVKPPIPRNVLKPNFGMHFLKIPIPPPKTCDCLRFFSQSCVIAR